MQRHLYLIDRTAFGHSKGADSLIPTGPTTRIRSAPFKVSDGIGRRKFREIADGSESPGFPEQIEREVGPTVLGTQKTESEGHPFKSRSPGYVGDLGGNFFTTRQYAIGLNRAGSYSCIVNWSPSIDKHIDYNGPIFPADPSSQGFPASIHSDNLLLDQLGATAIARCKPTNSPADAATFLGELYKDGLPKLVGSQTWKDRALSSRNAGSEYLNVVFGWEPLVGEIKDFAKAVAKADTVLKQYERDAGRVVRRRYKFPIVLDQSESNEITRVTWTNPTMLGEFGNLGQGGSYVKRTEKSWRRWFSGAFTYYLPTGYDSRKALSKHSLLAEQVLGLSFTPDTLWEVAPWSWAVDWFSNTGDVVSNISDYANDGLVMRYGYIMEHSIHKVTLVPTSSSLFDKKAKVSPISFVTETKVRRGANPFGFGIGWEGLSPKQLAIAAALGLSKR